MTQRLADRVALITGASSGIGEGAAISLAAAGAKVVVSGRRADRLEDLKKRIEAAGGEADFVAGDITDEAFAKGLIGETVKRFGSLDILVNSAGIAHFTKVETPHMDHWRDSMALNLYATIYTCSAAIPVMRAQGRGDIINISSTSGRRMIGTPYGCSKMALNCFQEGLRVEVGPYGIRTCIIEPGATASEIWMHVEGEVAREHMRQHLHKEGAMQPEDLGEAIVLVCALPQRADLCEILIRPTIDVAAGIRLV